MHSNNMIIKIIEILFAYYYSYCIVFVVLSESYYLSKCQFCAFDFELTLDLFWPTNS